MYGKPIQLYRFFYIMGLAMVVGIFVTLLVACSARLHPLLSPLEEKKNSGEAPIPRHLLPVPFFPGLQKNKPEDGYTLAEKDIALQNILSAPVRGRAKNIDVYQSLQGCGNITAVDNIFTTNSVSAMLKGNLLFKKYPPPQPVNPHDKKSAPWAHWQHC